MLPNSSRPDRPQTKSRARDPISPRLSLALLAAVLATSVQASPQLTGPLIRAVTTDRASYRAGEQAAVRITLQNGTGKPFNGAITGVMSGRGVPVGPPASVVVTALAAGASQVLDLRFPTVPNVDHHGYFVAIGATGQDGATLDSAGAAIDQSSDPTYYPRTCWRAQTYTRFGAYTPPAFATPDAAADTAVAWGCNIILMYDQLYKQHQPFIDTPAWTNTDQLLQSRDTVLRSIEADRARGMLSYAYVPIYAATGGAHPIFPPYTADGSGVSPSWGMYAADCAPRCTLAQQKGYPSDPAATAPLALMDPTNAAWQRYWIGANRELVRRYGYDGFFLDTYGAPHPSATVYTASGRAIDLSKGLSGFYNAVMSGVGSQGFINTVSGWGERDVSTNSSEPFYWSERHPEFGDMANYNSVNYTADVVTSFAGRHLGLVFALYMDLKRSQDPRCELNGGATFCAFNVPGMLFAEAMFGAAGAYHAEIADNDRFLTNEGFVVGKQLQTTPDLIQGMYDAAVFDRAYEKLTRDGVKEGYPALTTAITAGGTSSTGAIAGEVYALTKERAGLHIMHLVRMPKEGLNPQDPDANYSAPTRLGPITVKSYYPGTVSGSSRLWWASPDVDHGAPKQIGFSQGADAKGRYVTFTLPSLLYRDMAWLELDGLGSSDYATP